MRYRYEKIGVFLLILLLAVSVSLCTEKENDTKQESASSSGGHLRYAVPFGPTDTLDPSIKWIGWYMRQAGIYETLFSYDPNMELKPELATSYEQLSDTEWKINLRKDVKFHDGTPMNADAVVYSIERVKSPENTRKGEYSFIDSIRKNDEHSVIIKTTSTYAPTIASLTDPIVSIVNPRSLDLGKNPSGTGPFKFKGHMRDVSLDVVKNPNYWGGIPRLDSITIYVVPDAMSRLFKLESNEVDVVSAVPQSEVARLRDKGDMVIDDTETLRTFMLHINNKKEPLNNVNVRHAINSAIDRKEIIDTVLEGVGGTPAKCVFPSVLSWSNNKATDIYTSDKQKSKALLAEAGFKDIDNDGWLEYKGKPFELNIKTYTSRPQQKPSAELIKVQLESIGIKTTVTILQLAAVDEDMKKGDFDLVLYAWGVAPSGDPDYIMSRLFESNGSEATKIGYSNANVDEWIKNARHTMDEKERKMYYDKVNEQTQSDCPIIFLFYQVSLIGANKDVGGIVQFPSEVTFLTKDIHFK